MKVKIAKNQFLSIICTYIYIYTHRKYPHCYQMFKKQKKEEAKLGVAVCLGKLKIGRIPRKPGYKSSRKDVK